MSGWANHIEPIKDTRRRTCGMRLRHCQSQGRGGDVRRSNLRTNGVQETSFRFLTAGLSPIARSPLFGKALQHCVASPDAQMSGSAAAH